jgi:hypothetical protein
MDEQVVITRDIELDLSEDEAQALITDRWAEWMVERQDLEVMPGAVGTVEDGEQRRDVHVGEVAEGRVSFDWWPSDEPSHGSTVELTLERRELGVVLHIVETFPRRSTLSASAALRWSRLRVLAVV